MRHTGISVNIRATTQSPTPPKERINGRDFLFMTDKRKIILFGQSIVEFKKIFKKYLRFTPINCLRLSRTFWNTFHFFEIQWSDFFSDFQWEISASFIASRHHIEQSSPDNTKHSDIGSLLTRSRNGNFINTYFRILLIFASNKPSSRTDIYLTGFEHQNKL